MIEIIKEIGIFIVIAQSILYFVPGQTYAKYVKVIIGIIMIAKMTQPVLTLIAGEEWEKIIQQASAFADAPGFGEVEFQAENSRNEILLGIEEELTNRLMQAPAEGYDVRAVSVETNQLGEVEKIAITVSKPGKKKETGIRIERIAIGEQENQKQDSAWQEESRLKEYYGGLLTVPSEQIEICINE